jgi:hypothetical protein
MPPRLSKTSNQDSVPAEPGAVVANGREAGVLCS